MNRLTAVVTDINVHDNIGFIEVQKGGQPLNIVRLGIPAWLDKRDKIRCSFQEAAVCVGKTCDASISIENQIKGEIIAYRCGDKMCEITFSTVLGDIRSLITTRAFKTLDLEHSEEATLLLRATDITLDPIL
jgi:molybdopterin-binding protein